MPGDVEVSKRVRLALRVLAAAVAVVLSGASLVTLVLGGAPEWGLDFEGGLDLTLALDVPPDVDPEQARAQVIDALHERLESVDAEVWVVPRGSEIAVHVTGGDAGDHALVRSLVGRQVRLEFVDVLDERAHSLLVGLPQLPSEIRRETENVGRHGDVPYLRAPGADLARLERHVASAVDDDARLAVAREMDRVTRQSMARTYAVSLTPRLTGSDVADASTQLDERTGAPMVMIEFTSAGRVAFAEWTEQRVNQRIAIVVDGTVWSAPLVRERIRGGRASIDLGASSRSPEEQLAEAQTLVVGLRSGSLPSSVHVVNEVEVAPLYSPNEARALLYGPPLLLLVLLLGLAAWLRRRAAPLLVPVLTALWSAAGLSSLELVITSASVGGAFLGLFIAAASAALAGWAHRPGNPGPRGWVAVPLAVATVPMMACAGVGAILEAAARGPVRAAGASLLVVGAAGAVAAICTTIALAASGASAVSARDR